MLITPHALSGAALAILIRNPAIAAAAGISAHFALDTVPHWQETLPPYDPTVATWVRVPLDILASVGLVAAIARLHPRSASRIYLTAAAATLPDMDSLLYLDRRLRRGPFVERFGEWHAGLQRETSSLWGLVPQVALCLLCLALAMRGEAPPES